MNLKLFDILRKGSSRSGPREPISARFLHCGDSAIAVELASEIDEKANQRVIMLAEDLAKRPIMGIEEVVPTYRSLLVLYDPEIIRGQGLIEAVTERLEALVDSAKATRSFTIPVLYGHEAGLDLEEMAQMKGLTPQDVISIHSSAEYRVYMIGFAPPALPIWAACLKFCTLPASRCPASISRQALSASEANRAISIRSPRRAAGAFWAAPP